MKDKAILVIDMPTCCNVCTFNNAIGECKFVGNVDEALKHSLRYVKCPLKPMPERMKVDYDTITSGEVTEKVVAMGWNDCIATILGEENEWYNDDKYYY